MGRYRLIVCIITLSLTIADAVREQVIRQQRIGLLVDLIAINGQRVEMQQQRVFVLRRCCKRPARLFEEAVVLGMDLEGVIDGQIDALSDAG